MVGQEVHHGQLTACSLLCVMGSQLWTVACTVGHVVRGLAWRAGRRGFGAQNVRLLGHRVA